MSNPDELKAILDRIAAGKHTNADITALRDALIFSGDQTVAQLGKDNINIGDIGQARDIHIGDRIYQDARAEAIRDVIRQVLDEYSDKKRAGVEDRKTSYTRETLYSTLLPVSEMPRYIYGVPCKYNDSQEREAAKEIIRPDDETEMYPFLIRGGMLLCFQNLNNPNGPFRKLVGNQKVERYQVREWCNQPEHRQWFVSLLNRSLNKLTGRKGLHLDKIHRRYYFQPEESGKPLEVSYQPLNQSITSRNVVWQPVTKKTGEPKSYWYHLAVALKFHEVSKRHWCLSIRPEMRVTKDGLNLLDSKKIGSRVTKNRSRMFNYDLLSEVNFWRNFLSNGEPRIIFSFGKGQRIIVLTKMMQTEIEWLGIPEEYTKPFKNVEYEETLFSWAALARLDNEDAEEVDSWEDWDTDEDEEEEVDEL